MSKMHFQFTRSIRFNHNATVQQIIDGSVHSESRIPQHPHSLEQQYAGIDIDGKLLKLQVWMEASAPSTTKWYIDYDDTAPQTVTVTIGDP